MTRLSGAILIGLLACALGVTACGGSEPAEGEAEMVEAAPRAPDAAAVAAADRLSLKLGSDVKLVPTVRGLAEIGYERPRARRERDFIVTTFRVKVLTENAIAGFRVDEFWFDADGNTVTGDSVRFREPLLPGQVVDIELRVPRDPAMDRSNYEFSHQNGDILATLFESLDDPEEDEEAESQPLSANP